MNKEWLEIITGNPYVTLGLLLLAVFTFILMILFYYRSKRIKKPFYAVRSINLIQNFSSRLSSLKISYKDEQVENLTVSNVALWNGGKETIRKNDITNVKPLKISLREPYKILDAKIICSNNPANEISVGKVGTDGRTLLINFEYLDANEGCVLQIIHDGDSSYDLSVSGIIIGAGKPKKRFIPSILIPDVLLLFDTKFKRKRGIKRRELGITSFILGLTSIIASIYFLIFRGAEEKPGLIVFFFLGILYLTFSLMFLRKIPKGLESFEKEL